MLRPLACLVLALLLSTKLYGDEPAVERLSLDQAIHIAIQNNNSLENFTLDQETAADEVQSAKSFRYPLLSLNAVGAYVPLNLTVKEGELGTFPGIGTLPFTDFTVSGVNDTTATVVADALQPITQLHKINLKVHQLQLKNEISQEAIKGRRQTLIQEVKQTYYGILKNQSLVASLEDSEKTLKELDRTTEVYLTNGAVLKMESLEVKTRLLQVVTDHHAADYLLATQKEQLNFLMGRDILIPFEIVEVPVANVMEMDLAEARARALKQRVEISQADLGTKLADLQVQVSKAEKIPDLTFGVANVTPVNFDPVIPKNFWAVGLFLKWDVFDYGRKSNAVADAKRNAIKAKNDYDDARDQILIEVGDRFRKLQQSQDQLAVARLAQETAKETVRVTLVSYENQAALLADVLKSNSALADANNLYQQALLNFWTAKAEFEKAIGEEK
jgi:outer membrane protein TolC